MLKIRLMIADDLPMVREGLVAMLSPCEDINVICTCDGTCANVEKANQVVRTSNPDVILMDIKIGAINGIDVAKQVMVHSPDIKIIFLTVFDDAKFMSMALQAGAGGYISKYISSERLIDSIKRVYQGERIIEPTVINTMINDYINLSQKISPVEAKERTIQFTPREKEIFFYLRKGMTNKELSMVTHLSVETIKTHLHNMFRKLDVKNRSQAINQGSKHIDLSEFNYNN